jgi:uncharacterized protein YbjT (DUF2867 family)
MSHEILVAGATGFVGRALIPALCAHGHHVRACARHVPEAAPPGVEHVRCDLADAIELPRVLAGIDTAFYLVHSLGRGGGFREYDRRCARTFAEAAALEGLRRVIYLGGVAPRRHASEHLASRREVGEILRAGNVPAIELRASMIVGHGSASWQIVRDLALRLPAMVMPSWLGSRLRPIALADAVRALIDAIDLPVAHGAVFDIPGPDTLTGREILERVAALEGRALPAIGLPFLTPRISALWLRLITRADYQVARELVLGLTEDLLPEDERFWELTGWPHLLSFDEAARRALDEERRIGGSSGFAGFGERAVRRLSPRLRRSHDAGLA